MAAVNGTRLRLAVQLTLAGHGLVPWLAMLTLASALVAGFWILPQSRAEASRLQQHLSRLSADERTSAKLASALRKQSLTPAGLASVVESKAATPAFVQDIWDSAETYSVRIEHADYHTEPASRLGYDRLGVRVPVVGTYSAIKHYIFGLMHRHPSLALEQVQIKREGANQEQLEVELQFTLYVAVAS